jgi:hypothetical protein
MNCRALFSRRSAVGVALAATLALPSIALADQVVDGVGNADNFGSGAAFQPQTRHELTLDVGRAPVIQANGIEVAGVQVASTTPLILSALPDLSGDQLAPLGFARGTVLRGEDNVLYLSTDVPDSSTLAVRLPVSAISAADIPTGALVAANGVAVNGMFEAVRVTVWPAGAP